MKTRTSANETLTTNQNRQDAGSTLHRALAPRPMAGIVAILLAVVTAGTVTAESFPATAITSKKSTSVYATSKNAFSAGKLAGQCTWYAYGRVIELAEAGYLDSSAVTLMYNAFWSTSGRHARYWPDTTFLGGTWIKTDTTPLPSDKRKPGMLVVWIPAKTSNPGHVGFVEEVSADLKQYRLSDFNRGMDEKYRDKWYNYDDQKDWLKTTAPCFYQLPLPAAASSLAQITQPTPGSVLAGSTVTFTWSAGTGVSKYWLYIGSTLGANDMFSQDQGMNTSVNLTGFPSGSRLLYFRLWSLVGSTWNYSDCTFTTAR